MPMLLTEGASTAFDVTSLMGPFFTQAQGQMFAVIGATVTGAAGILTVKWGITWAINFFGSLVKRRS